MSTKAYRDANKEKIRQYNKKYREDNKEYFEQYRIDNKVKIQKYALTPKHRYNSARYHAKRRNKEWLLSFEEYSSIINNSCYYCNDVFGEKVLYGSSLDRLDNSKGYISNNVVCCCGICNLIKGDHFTTEETIIAVQAVIQHRNNKDK